MYRVQKPNHLKMKCTHSAANQIILFKIVYNLLVAAFRGAKVLTTNLEISIFEITKFQFWPFSKWQNFKNLNVHTVLQIYTFFSKIVQNFLVAAFRDAKVSTF